MRRVRTTAERLGSIALATMSEGDDGESAFEPTALELPALVADNTDFVFRCLRRAGLDSGTAEDGAQLVFLTAARKLGRIAAGKERAFLYATAMHVAADLKRKASRRGETELSEEQMDDIASGPSSSPDHAFEQQRARELLDEVLSAMPDHLRDVFVLSELEEMTAPAVAVCLDLPSGTVASRLARARLVFDECLARIKARRSFRSTP
jgi:RNA polymerase sigma-70 factor, ECF subfamily